VIISEFGVVRRDFVPRECFIMHYLLIHAIWSFPNLAHQQVTVIVFVVMMVAFINHWSPSIIKRLVRFVMAISPGF
jgi:hypothetical protein